MRWAFKHLIKNACDYTLPGGLIRITAADEDGCFVLKVRDTGVGIARHEKAHIFEQFYRGQPASPDGAVSAPWRLAGTVGGRRVFGETLAGWRWPHAP